MSGTLDSKLLRPDPLLLLPMLEEGDGDFPYSWNLGSKKKKNKRTNIDWHSSKQHDYNMICCIAVYLYDW